MQLRWTTVIVLAVLVGCARGGEREVNLLSMGDWGRGSELQKRVAGNMAGYVGKLPGKVEGCLLAGDNFYVPLASTSDPNFQNVFERVYDKKILDFPFYVALGNHDYVNPKEVPADKKEMEFGYAREHPESRWKLPGNWYRVDFPSKEKPLVSVLMLNSNQPRLTAGEWAGQIEFIDRELGDRRGAVWMIACAHHPLYSNGAHGDNGVLQTQWGTLFEKHHLDFYVAGHDHDLQELQLPGRSTTFLMVGGGGATTRPMLRDQRGQFSMPNVGFTHLKLTQELATVTYVSGLDGSVLHRIERTAGGTVTVTKQGVMAKATTKPLQTIQGLDQKKKKDDD